MRVTICAKMALAFSVVIEQMSATSEEPAARAEQLQSSIAYFRTDTNGGTAAPPQKSPLGRAVRPVTPARPIKPVSVKAASYTNGRSKPGGHTLHLGNGGADPRDAEFERI